MPDIRPLLRQLDESGADTASQLATLKQFSPDDFADFTEADYASFRDKVKYPLPRATTVTQPKPKSVNVIEALRPFLATGATIAGTAAGTALTKNPTMGKAAGLGAAAAVDYGMQALEGKDREDTAIANIVGAGPESPVTKLANTGQMGLENLIGGKIMSGLASGAKGVYQEFTKGGIANPLLREMGATYSMYQNRPFAEFIENVSNVFHNKKTEALESINRNATQMVSKLTSQITGRLPKDVDSQNKISEFVNKQLNKVFEASKAESTREGSRAQEIADMFEVPVFKGNQTVQTQVPATGISSTIPGTTMVTQNVTQPMFDKIKGPVYINSALEDAYRLIKNAPKSLQTPEEQKKVLHAANQMITQSGAKFDPNTGKVISSNPVSFADAWQFTKDLDELAFSGAKEGIVDPNSRLFKHLATKIRDDVEASIPGWANPLQPKSQILAQEALASWKASKEIVKQRNQIFDRATQIPKMLAEQTSIIPEIDKVIADPKQLEKALRLSKLPVPTSGGPVIMSNNLRKDLSGYEFKKIMDDAWVNTDPTDATKGYFDKNKMIGEFLDPKKKDSYEILFSAGTRKRIETFFDAVNKTAQSGKSPYTSSVLARATYAGITLGGGLVAANNLDDSRAQIAGVILGGTLGLNAVGRLMSNPFAARVLTSMVEGAPLGMSEKAASKILFTALQGARMSLQLNDGTEKNAMITADGKVKVLD